jgi:hypothetical protein
VTDPIASSSGARRPPLWLGVVLLVLALLAAFGAGAYYSWATLNFERTDGAIFTEWVYAEFSRAAGIGVLVTAIAAVLFAVLRRRRPWFAMGAAVAAVLVVAALIGAAALSRAYRFHPINKERAIARSFPLPDGWGFGTVDVEKGDAFTDSPPSVTRVMDVADTYPHVCRQLLAALTGWRGARLVPWSDARHDPLDPNLRSGLGCSMLGKSPQGWSLDLVVFVHRANAGLRPGAIGNVPAGMTRVLVRVGTPT